MSTNFPMVYGIPIQGLERELIGIYPQVRLGITDDVSQLWEDKRSLSQKVTILKLLKKYGNDTLSYFSLQKNRKYFFSSTQQSFLSYCIKGNIAVVAANPIGKQEELPQLVESFLLHLQKNNKKPCFVGLSKGYTYYLKKKHYKIFKIGEEAIIDLVTFDVSLLKKKVRRVLRHMHRSEVHVQIYNRQHIPAPILKQIKETSRRWLSCKKKKERGFSMTLGSIPTKFHNDCEFIVAMKGKMVLGYLCFVPVYKANAWSLDSMRRREDTPNGLMEFLMIQAARQYKLRGFTKLSLNFATFANSKNDVQSKFFSRILSVVYAYLSKFYQCHSLHTFNQKFLPEWESRYVAFPNLRSVPSSTLAIIQAEKIF